MAEVHYCDICEEILKGEVFIHTVTKISPDVPNHQPFTTLDLFQAMEKNSDKKSRTSVKEICIECHNVLKYLFNIRLKTLKTLRKETNNILKEIREGETNEEVKDK